MDGLIAPNAPIPPQPSSGFGISEILFDIGGIVSSDPRNARADLALIFYQLAASLKPEHDFAWLMIAGLYEQFQMVPKAIEALGKIGRTRRSTGRPGCGQPRSTPGRRSSTRPSPASRPWLPRSPTASTPP